MQASRERAQPAEAPGVRSPRHALEAGVPHYTTAEGARWVAEALARARDARLLVTALQAWQGGALEDAAVETV